MERKIKYSDESYRQPIYPCQKVTNKIYFADGTSGVGTPSIATQYRTPDQTISEFDDEFDIDFDAKFFGNTVSRKTEEKDTCCGKSRYIHAPYNAIPNMSSGGFGDIKDFSALRFGESTRRHNSTIADVELNRSHFTYRDYSAWKSFPQPENTRLSNKKTLKR